MAAVDSVQTMGSVDLRGVDTKGTALGASPSVGAGGVRALTVGLGTSVRGSTFLWLRDGEGHTHAAQVDQGRHDRPRHGDLPHFYGVADEAKTPWATRDLVNPGLDMVNPGRRERTERLGIDDRPTITGTRGGRLANCLELHCRERI